jgi:hypothetical protein
MQHNKSFEKATISGEGEIDLNDSKAINYMSPMQNEKLKELQSTSESFAKQVPETTKIVSPVI